MLNNIKPNKVFLFVGQRGTGKTTAMFDVSAQRKNKHLLFSFAHDERFDKLESILPESLHLCKNKAYKINRKQEIEFNKRNEYVDFVLLEIFQKYKEGSIILDDATHIVRFQRKDTLLYLLTDVRHLRCDVYLAFHSLPQVPAFVWDMTNYVFLFKTNRPPDDKITELDSYEKILTSWKEVNANNDPHAVAFIEISP